jgi:hypothetical protein
MFGIVSDFEKGFRTGAKQKVVDQLLVLQGQWCQLARQREDNMDVARREQLLATRCEPAVASPGLTLRAVPVAARVVGDGTMHYSHIRMEAKRAALDAIAAQASQAVIGAGVNQNVNQLPEGDSKASAKSLN